MLPNDFISALTSLLSDHFGLPVSIKGHEQVFGGDINETFVLHNSAGKYFLKINHHVPPDMFVKEYSGLQTLSKAAFIHVPEPILYGGYKESIFLVMKYIQKGKPQKDFWQYFAQGLAGLHRITQYSFGFKENNYIGPIRQGNDYEEGWPAFYANQRIMPLMREAYAANKCSKYDLAKAEKLCARLHQLFPEEPPALLHGDLWSGNFMADQAGDPVIYDPAVYYGNREMDIAMAMLFGGFDRNFYSYYNEIFPLEKHWEQRVALCQLYPLLVHLILFGGHYYSGVMNTINRYL